MPPLELLRLLQLTSPALPIGSFAFSQGLETAVSLGWIRDEASAQSFLGGVLADGFARLDLPVLLRLHAAWLAESELGVERWSDYLLASRESSERADEDRQLGRALARLLADQGIERAKPWLRSDHATYAAQFALASAHFGIPAEPALLGFAFAMLEAQVGALSRLVPLGQLAAQRVLTFTASSIPPAIALARSLSDDELGATLPSLAIASALHETQYTRLFKS